MQVPREVLQDQTPCVGPRVEDIHYDEDSRTWRVDLTSAGGGTLGPYSRIWEARLAQVAWFADNG
jgi:hypothetical protein